MKRAYFVGLLGVAIGSFLGVASCGEETTTLPPAVPKDTGTQGTDTAVTSDSSGTETSMTDSRTEGGGTGGCPATIKSEGSVKDIRDPASSKKVIGNDGVKLNGVVVTSIKWRTRNPSKVGDPCLFSIFVADPNTTFAPWSGVQIIAYGDDAVAADGGRATCATDSDPIPNDIKVGDIVDITGTYSEFGPSSSACGGAMPAVPVPNPDKAPQVRACLVAKKGSGTVPAAAVIADPNKIGQGSTELLQWAGGRVKIGPVEVGSADTFGNFTIKGTSAAVSDIIWYRGTGWKVKAGDKFDEITGMPLIDFCTWSLAPSFCNDAKASAGTDIQCPTSGGSDAGVDASLTDALPGG